MVLRRRGNGGNIVLLVCVSIICGFSFTLWLQGRLRVDACRAKRDVPPTGRPPPAFDDVEPGKNLLFVGVMTARAFLDNRAAAVYATWGRTLPGKLAFFSSEGSVGEGDMPVVALPGVTDHYPPQKKSFMMLKYMYDHYVDKFEWFMRADDDVYIRGDKMEKFLRSVNSSKPQFIGQAGIGKKHELGKLGLAADENFCMGGPGMIFSRATLKLVAPHIKYCLSHMYSTHEDVEIGRCVQQFANISCSWTYEMQTILFHNSTERKEDERESFTGDLYTPEVIQATTLHPFKVTAHLYRAHAFFHALKTRDLRHKTLLLQRDVRDMDVLLGDRTGGATYVDDALGLHSGLNKFRPRSRESVLTWNFMSRAVYAAGGYQPKCGFDQALKHSLQDIVMQVMFMINKHSRQRGRVIDFREILYGYYRHDPRHGADYIVDILLTYKKYAGRKMTVPVRRHAYIQQAFTAPEFREEMPDPSPPPSEHQGAPPRDGADFNSGDADLPTAAAAAAGGAQTTVHFVLPLAGRYTTFKRFLSNFESACLRGEERVTLAVILFTHAYEDRRDDTVAAVATLRAKYPRYDLQTVHAAGAFSRGLALQIGARLRRADALLFFVDVDIYFSRDFLERARLNARRGVSVYFPIVFSQYNPRTVDAGEERDVFSIDDDVGYWREFGYGIACVYNSDLHAVGGFDLTIEGWGREDVDLFERFLASGNVTVVRAPDPGLVHIYHDKTCDPGLDAAQLTMCRGSDTNGYGSTRRLADVVYARPDLLGMTDEDDDEDGDAT